MKTRAVIISCLLAITALSCESAYPQLNSIDDLKDIDFGQSLPKHTLLLLHWFANTVNIDYNDVVHLTFDPNTDFGSHYYSNYEDMLDQLPRGYRYYTVGGLNEDTSDELPDYVLNPPVREYYGNNRERIIFSVHKQNSIRRIDRIYITQHDGQSNSYDPEHTYQISTNLLRQIRQFSVENQRSLSSLRHQFHSSADDYQLRATWGNLACLGLMLFIVIQDRPRIHFRPQSASGVITHNKRENDTEMNSTLIIAALLIIAAIIFILNSGQIGR